MLKFRLSIWLERCILVLEGLIARLYISIRSRQRLISVGKNAHLKVLLYSAFSQFSRFPLNICLESLRRLYVYIGHIYALKLFGVMC